jgi:E3 ubiquitin-protein ligase UBR4
MTSSIAIVCRTQIEIGKEILPILHNLEQISSDEHVGSLAENLLEALKENATVAAKVWYFAFSSSQSLFGRSA